MKPYEGLTPELRESIRHAAAASLSQRRRALRLCIFSLAAVILVGALGLWIYPIPDRVRPMDSAASEQGVLLTLRSAPFDGTLTDVRKVTTRNISAADCRTLLAREDTTPLSDAQQQEAFEQALSDPGKVFYLTAYYAPWPGIWVEPLSLTLEDGGPLLTLAEDTDAGTDSAGESDPSAAVTQAPPVYGQKSCFFYILAVVDADAAGEESLEAQVIPVDELTAGQQAEFHVRRLLDSPAGQIASSLNTLVDAQPAAWKRLLGLSDDAFSYMLDIAWSDRSDPSSRTRLMAMACMERVTGISPENALQSAMAWLDENYAVLSEQGFPAATGALLIDRARKELLVSFDRTDREQALEAALLEALTSEGYPAAAWELAGEQSAGENRVTLYLWASVMSCGVDWSSGEQGPVLVTLEQSGKDEAWYPLEVRYLSLTDPDFDEVFGQYAGKVRKIYEDGYLRILQNMNNKLQAAADSGLPLCLPEHLSRDLPS